MDPEEQELLSDYRYRNYSSVIEKALRNFESSSEWGRISYLLGEAQQGMWGWECLHCEGRAGTQLSFYCFRTCLFNIILHADYSHQIRRTAANLSPSYTCY